MSLCLYFDSTFKQLKSLTSINTYWCLCGLELALQTAVQKVLGSISGAGKDIYACFFVFVVVFLLSCKQNIYMNFCNSFCNVNSFSILNILQNSRPIIRVSRYRPSIFNGGVYLPVTGRHVFLFASNYNLNSVDARVFRCKNTSLHVILHDVWHSNFICRLVRQRF